MSGETFESVMAMDMRILFFVYRAYLRRRETNLNDFLQCGHTLTAKQAQAFSDGDKFADPIKNIKLIKEDEEIQNIVDMANDFNMKPSVVRKQILKG